MESIDIRRVTLNDVDQLQSVGKQTFSETFSESNTEADMQQYLDEKLSIEKLTDELSNRDTAFYFAAINNNVIGYLKLNSGAAQTELKDGKSLEIERIYVLKDFHGKLIGQLLYEKAIEIAKQTNADYVWLGVWEKNQKAIRFYKRNGFVEFDKHIFKLGSDEQIDIMMKLHLNIK